MKKIEPVTFKISSKNKGELGLLADSISNSHKWHPFIGGASRNDKIEKLMETLRERHDKLFAGAGGGPKSEKFHRSYLPFPEAIPVESNLAALIRSKETLLSGKPSPHCVVLEDHYGQSDQSQLEQPGSTIEKSWDIWCSEGLFSYDLELDLNPQDWDFGAGYEDFLTAMEVYYDFPEPDRDVRLTWDLTIGGHINLTSHGVYSDSSRGIIHCEWAEVPDVANNPPVNITIWGNMGKVEGRSNSSHFGDRPLSSSFIVEKGETSRLGFIFIVGIEAMAFHAGDWNYHTTLEASGTFLCKDCRYRMDPL